MKRAFKKMFEWLFYATDSLNVGERTWAAGGGLPWRLSLLATMWAIYLYQYRSNSTIRSNLRQTQQNLQSLVQRALRQAYYAILRSRAVRRSFENKLNGEGTSVAPEDVNNVDGLRALIVGIVSALLAILAVDVSSVRTGSLAALVPRTADFLDFTLVGSLAIGVYAGYQNWESSRPHAPPRRHLRADEVTSPPDSRPLLAILAWLWQNAPFLGISALNEVKPDHNSRLSSSLKQHRNESYVATLNRRNGGTVKGALCRNNSSSALHNYPQKLMDLCTDQECTNSLPRYSAESQARPYYLHKADQSIECTVGTGIENLGNTCFVNAIVQCLRFTPGLVTALETEFSIKHTREIRDPSASLKSSSEGIEKNAVLEDACLRLLDLLAALQDGTSARAVDASQFLEACSRVPLMAELIEKPPTQSWIGTNSSRQHQQDAQEFLTCLLETFHSILRRQPRPLSNREEKLLHAQREGYHDTLLACSASDPQTYMKAIQALADLEWREHCRRESSVITDLFSGQMVRGSMCIKCRNLSCSHQEFRFLPLKIVESPDTNVAQGHESDETKSSYAPSSWTCRSSLSRLSTCLDNLKAAQVLSGDEQRVCSGACGNIKTDSETQILLQRLPPCLVIQLQRFQQTMSTYGLSDDEEDEGFLSGLVFQKDTTRVDFPVSDLDMTDYLLERDFANPTKYDLFAVCAHEGSTLDSGHYVAYCRNPKSRAKENMFSSTNIEGTVRPSSHDTSSWVRFSDTSLRHISEEDMKEMTASDSYLLFYFIQERNYSPC